MVTKKPLMKYGKSYRDPSPRVKEEEK